MRAVPKVTRLAALVVFAVGVLAACGTGAAAQPSIPSSPQVDATAAARMLDAALKGYNDGSYGTWTADWSDDMKAAIGEKDFAAVREQLMSSYGRYVSLSAPEISSHAPGTYRWTFRVAFEKGSATLWIAFRGAR